MGVLVERVAHIDLGKTFGQSGHELVMDAFRYDDTRGRRATLAGGVEAGVGCCLNCNAEVRIIQNHERVLATHFKLEFTVERQ
ncbi:hypothetical protein D3C80_1737020 [compost metagenome]